MAIGTHDHPDHIQRETMEGLHSWNDDSSITLGHTKLSAPASALLKLALMDLEMKLLLIVNVVKGKMTWVGLVGEP
jgi:hypothetical protein